MWSDSELQVWAQAVQAGDVTAAPAEGVYGYCVDPFNSQALEAVMTRKKRAASKGFICLVRSVKDLVHICDVGMDTRAKEAVCDYWPCSQKHPITLVLPAKKGLPEHLTGGRTTVAVRMPQTPYMQAYLAAWQRLSGYGVLLSTSLNESGAAPAYSAQDVPDDVARLVLDTPLSGASSQVLEPVSGTWLRS